VLQVTKPLPDYPIRNIAMKEIVMNAKKPDATKSDLDRGLTVKKENLQQLTVKTGLRGGLAAMKAACCSGCHCSMAAS
jgi:hypothetical protein